MLHLYIATFYFALSLLVGLMGYDRKFGFWGYFFASLLLSPFLGILLVLASDPLPDDPDPTEEETPSTKNSTVN